MGKDAILTAVDIGTSKVCAVIARGEEGGLRILGTGWRASKGVRRGVIVDMGQTVECVRQALEEAEEQADRVTESAYVCVGGAYVRGLNLSGGVEIRDRSGEVTRDEIMRAVERAHDFEVPENSRILHVLRRSFTVDGQDGIHDPEGMSGRRLTAHVHVMLTASGVVANLVRSVNKTGARVETAVAQPLASGEAVLSEDERELGVMLIDMGAGTTDVALHRRGAIFHSESFPAGGHNITKDIAIGLKASLEEAERIKRESAGVIPEEIPDGDLVEVSPMGGGAPRSIPRQLVCQIARARFDEIIQQAAQSVKALELKPDSLTGAVLTGGGSLLDGARERAGQLLGLSVRGGFPANVVGADSDIHHPAYAAVLGLLLYARDVQAECEGGALTLPRGAAGDRVRRWIREKIS